MTPGACHGTAVNFPPASRFRNLLKAALQLTVSPCTCQTSQHAALPAGHGTAVNSSSASSKLALDGLPTMEAQQRVIDWLEQHRLGQRKVNFKLRDWLFARQRYWGEPFPIIYPEGSEVGPARHPSLQQMLLSFWGVLPELHLGLKGWLLMQQP